MNRLLVVIAVLCGTVAQAQTHQVIRLGGDTLLGDQLTWHRPVMQTPYLMLDSTQILWTEVQEFGNGFLWFMNERPAEEEVYLLRRTMQCSLDLYAEVTEEEVASYPIIQMGGNIRSNEAALPFTHYTAPDGALKTANYRNLQADAGMYPVSAMALREYKWLTIAQWATFLGGIGLTSYAVSQDEFSASMVLGITLGAGSTLFAKPKRERLWQAATYYGVEAEPIE